VQQLRHVIKKIPLIEISLFKKNRGVFRSVNRVVTDGNKIIFINKPLVNDKRIFTGPAND